MANGAERIETVDGTTLVASEAAPLRLRGLSADRVLLFNALPPPGVIEPVVAARAGQVWRVHG